MAISLQFDKWAKPKSPQLIVSEVGAISPAGMSSFVNLGRWHKISMRLTPGTWQLSVDGKPVGGGAVGAPDRIKSFFEGTTQTLAIGNFIGIADEIHVSGF